MSGPLVTDCAPRPEKDHAKQLHALALLLERYPQYRDGAGRVHLTLIGGSRGPADEARLRALQALAAELGLSVSALMRSCAFPQTLVFGRAAIVPSPLNADPQGYVTFLVNAPYGEVVRQLGRASIGLNTMQDEHFGINVVEFMVSSCPDEADIPGGRAHPRRPCIGRPGARYRRAVRGPAHR